jgi:hypothetical protein
MASETAIYLKDGVNKRPETTEAVLSTIQGIIEALKAGKPLQRQISLPDRFLPLLPEFRLWFLAVEDFEVVGIYESSPGYFAVDARARLDAQNVRIAMVLREEEEGIKLVAVPLVGPAATAVHDE